MSAPLIPNLFAVCKVLVAAIIATEKMRKPRNWGPKTYQAGSGNVVPNATSGRSCCWTIFTGSRVPVKTTRAITARTIGME